MNIQEHIKSFTLLGLFFAGVVNDVHSSDKNINEFKETINKAEILNPWFTKANIHFSILHWSKMLTEKNISNWLSRYDFKTTNKPHKVGVIMAGNIPMVGFHDMLSVLISGNIFIGKLSSKDDLLLKATSEFLIKINNKYKKKILWEENKLTEIDAIIATGSDNTARYFEYYFGRYPNIIRKNRNSIAILSGDETVEEMTLLADDIFLYFGLGCRNVSKIYMPENYEIARFFKPLEKWDHVTNHNKYMNNYEYNRTILLMNSEPYHDNGFLILKQNDAIASPIAIMFYEYYKNLEELKEKINFDKGKIQCIVGNEKGGNNTIPFGTSQRPELWEYADNIDTLTFLNTL